MKERISNGIQSTPDKRTSVKGTISLTRTNRDFLLIFPYKVKILTGYKNTPQKMSLYPWIFLYKFRDAFMYKVTDQNFCKYHYYS